jgi:serine protease Do
MRLEGALLLLVMLVAAVLVSGPPGLAGGAEPPASFARVAAAARAASIVIRGPDAEGIASSIPVDSDPDEEQLEGLSPGRERILGSGVIVDPRGFAVTSARAVRLAPGFEVALIDGRLLKATVVGLDRRTDVAVLKLHSDATLPHLPLGDSDLVEVGDWVIAVGAPAGLEGTVSAGIITAKPTPESSSPLASFLQTDAATGRGNAGGPIVAMSGEIVGLGTVLRGEGIGYALPARIVRKVYLELLEKGRVSRPWLGAMMQSVTADLARVFRARAGVGVLIADVLPASPAASGGLRSGDIVVEVGGTAVSSRAQVERVISGLMPGRIVRLKVHRAAHELVASVKLGEEPDEWQALPALARARRLFGIDVRPITPTMGAVIVNVDPDGPADVVGIEPGDVIREVDRQPVGNITDFHAIARALRAATEVLMLVQRGDVALYVVVRARK